MNIAEVETFEDAVDFLAERTELARGEFEILRMRFPDRADELLAMLDTGLVTLTGPLSS